MSNTLTEKQSFRRIEQTAFWAKNRRFLRFQLTALLATLVDFSLTVFFKNVFGFHYTLAVALGACSGAITAFIVNRYWVFSSTNHHPAMQAIKYSAVVAGSVILNTGGTYLLTETTILTYLISKAIVALIVGFTYSYYFSKRFVFHV